MFLLSWKLAQRGLQRNRRRRIMILGNFRSLIELLIFGAACCWCTAYLMLTLLIYLSLDFRGVTRGGQEGRHALQSSIELIFYRRKLAFLGLFFLPEVFCGPQICQKCFAGWGAHDTPPSPSRLGNAHSLALSTLRFWHLRRSALSFCGFPM